MTSAGEAEATFMGIVAPQMETTESYVIGQGCKGLRGVQHIGGPAALPSLLSTKIALFYDAGYRGYKLRDMVSQDLSKALPGSGPWNLAEGSIDWNLYHEQNKICTVAVKMQEWGSDWIAYAGTNA